jgi:ParB/RepB/Spo0J family partition protein
VAIQSLTQELFMSLKEYSAADGAHIDTAPAFDTEAYAHRLAEDRQWYAHQAMHGRASDVVVQIPLADVQESPHNPRQTCNTQADAELDDSVRAVGIMQPVLVRPVRLEIDPLVISHYELVYGHRRLRSAQRCGLATLPATVQELSDDQAAQMQAIENLQREDITVMEEAKGYADYLRRHQVSKDELATRIGKSRTYVYNRLKLAELEPGPARALQEGKIKPEVATLLARVPKALQDKALVEITTNHPGRHGEPAPFRWVRDQLLEKFSLDLGEAIFSTDDATLLPKAGACTTCPNRSGCSPEIYQDVIAQANWTHHWMADKKGSAQICMDPTCFAEKKKAHLVREAKALEGKGATVVTGNAAKSALDAQGKVKGAYVELKAVKKILGQIAEKDRPKVVTIIDQRTGKTVQAVKRAELAEFGADAKEVATAKPSNQDSYAERQAKNAKEAEQQTAANRRLLADVRAAAAKEPRSAVDLRLVAQAMFELMDYDDRDVLQELQGPDGSDVRKLIDTVGPDELALLLLDMALVQNVVISGYQLGYQPERLLAAAAHYGVQVGLGTVVAGQDQDAEEGEPA